MGMKTIPDGQGFSYPAEFGFTGSSKGPNNPLSHPTQDHDEFGDGTYLAQKSAAEPTLSHGGKVPAPKAAKAVLGALQVGKMIGQREATPSAGMPTAPSAIAPPPAMTSGPMAAHLNGMACGGRVGMAEGGLSKGPMHFDGGDHQYDSDAGAAEAEAHAQTVPGAMTSADPEQSDAEIMNPHGDGYAGGGKFIQKAIKHPGALHADLGVPQGHKIPVGKLAAAAKKSGKVGQRARFAETLRGLNHSKKD